MFCNSLFLYSFNLMMLSLRSRVSEEEGECAYWWDFSGSKRKFHTVVQLCPVVVHWYEHRSPRLFRSKTVFLSADSSLLCSVNPARAELNWISYFQSDFAASLGRETRRYDGKILSIFRESIFFFVSTFSPLKHWRDFGTIERTFSLNDFLWRKCSWWAQRGSVKYK